MPSRSAPRPGRRAPHAADERRSARSGALRILQLELHENGVGSPAGRQGLVMCSRTSPIDVELRRRATSQSRIVAYALLPSTCSRPDPRSTGTAVLVLCHVCRRDPAMSRSLRHGTPPRAAPWRTDPREAVKILRRRSRCTSSEPGDVWRFCPGALTARGRRCPQEDARWRRTPAPEARAPRRALDLEHIAEAKLMN